MYGGYKSATAKGSRRALIKDQIKTEHIRESSFRDIHMKVRGGGGGRALQGYGGGGMYSAQWEFFTNCVFLVSVHNKNSRFEILVTSLCNANNNILQILSL